MNLLEKIISCPKNKNVLKVLQLKNSMWIKTGSEAVSIFDEGSQVFFDKYAKLLPNETKIAISIHNLLINPKSGEIFAFQHGRFTFFLKCDFSKSPISEPTLKTNTLDGWVDFDILGKEWTILNVDFEDEEDEQFLYAYQRTFQNTD